MPHVEIRKAPVDDDSIAGAVHNLAVVQRSQLAVGAGYSADELRPMQEEERD